MLNRKTYMIELTEMELDMIIQQLPLGNEVDDEFPAHHYIRLAQELTKIKKLLKLEVIS